MTKHTPGPWEADTDSDQKSWEIYSIYMNTLTGHRGNYVIAETSNRDFRISPEEDRANGRLMAQAPAMYEAIDEMLESAADGRQVPEWVCERMVSMRAIQSAIQGETP